MPDLNIWLEDDTEICIYNGWESKVYESIFFRYGTKDVFSITSWCFMPSDPTGVVVVNELTKKLYGQPCKGFYYD